VAYPNRRFTSGLSGTQTDGSGGPFRGPSPVCTRFWGVGRAIGAFASALTVFGLAWVSGPEVSAETVVGGGSSPSMTASPFTLEVKDWTPTPQPGLSMVAGDRHKSLTLEQWRALQAFPDHLQLLFACIARAESGFDAEASIIDIDGLPREGAWMVGATWWGEVPADLADQAVQASLIASEHGSKPWTTAGGC